MKLKNTKIVVLCIMLSMGMFIPVFANDSGITEDNQESQSLIEQNGLENDDMDTTASIEEEAVEEVEEQEDVAQRVETKTDEQASLFASAIQDETELHAALTGAVSGDTITIQGGVTIELSSELVVNSLTQSELKFVSSNDQEVILINANGKRHIAISGANAINLDFNNVVLSGNLDAEYRNGGIEILNDALGNRINGLIVRDNITANGREKGIIKYKGQGGSFELSNTSFINNQIDTWLDAASSIVYIDGTDSNLTLDAVTFDGNETQNQNGSALGIYNNNAVATISNLSISNGKAKSNSAGVKYIGYRNSNLYLTHSSFADNVNTSGTAGAFLLTLNEASNAEFSNVEFVNNYGDRGGGAILATLNNTGTFKLDSINFLNNSSSRVKYNPETGEQTGLPSNGGALYIEQRRGNSNVEITNSKFLGNEANTGGAMYIGTMSPGKVQVLVEDSVFDGNTSDYTAGAIYLSTASHLEEKSFIFKNTSIINNTVTGNDPGPGYYEGGDGGGIYLADNPQVLALDSVTFDNNKSKTPFVWNYSPEDTSYPNPVYLSNVTNTTKFTQPQYAFLENYNNAFNGDDVYIDFTALTYFLLNEDEIEDLVVENYDETFNYYFSMRHTKVLEPIAPIASGYKFLGWYDQNGVKWDFNTMSQTEVHNYLEAKWEKLPEIYTITYTDGTGNESIFADLVFEIAEGESTPLYEETIERYGYSFEGWSPAISDTVTGNVTYIAQWVELDTFTVTYTDGVDGTVFKDQVTKVYINEASPLFEGADPVREGYKFMGWSPKHVTVVKENIIYTAQWEKVEVADAPKLPATGLSGNYYGISVTALGVLCVFVGMNKRKKISIK